MGVGAKCKGNARERRAIPGERMGVSSNCHGKAGECRGLPGEHESGCIVPGECRELPGECKGAGVKCYGNEGECKGMPGERTREDANCQGNAGNYQGNVRGRV